LLEQVQLYHQAIPKFSASLREIQLSVRPTGQIIHCYLPEFCIYLLRHQLLYYATWRNHRGNLEPSVTLDYYIKQIIRYICIFFYHDSSSDFKWYCRSSDIFSISNQTDTKRARLSLARSY